MLNQSKESKFLTYLVHKLTLLVKNLQESLQKTKTEFEPKFRFVDWMVREKTKEGYCVIQIIGTAHVINKLPKEIITDKQLLYGFSPQDVHIITTLAHLESNRPDLKILSMDFIENIVTLSNNNGNHIHLSIKELYKNKNLLSQLTTLDAFKLGKFIGDTDSVIS